MKKRALILAMIAFIAATTSEPSINMVRAEETQVEETQTEENAGQTSELPIKTPVSYTHLIRKSQRRVRITKPSRLR